MQLAEVGAAACKDIVPGLAPVADLAQLGDSMASEPVFDLTPVIIGKVPVMGKSAFPLAGRAYCKVIQGTRCPVSGPQLTCIGDLEPLAEIPRGDEPTRVK